MPARQRLTPKERLALLKRVYKDHFSVTKTCKESGVSRFTFYELSKRYIREASDEVNLKLLSDRFRRKKAHYRSIPPNLQQKILELVYKNAEFSTHKLAALVPGAGNHGVQLLFEKIGLNTRDNREKFTALTREEFRKFLRKENVAIREYFSPEERLAIVQRIVEKKEKVAKVCQEVGISRFTFYRWLKLYEQDSSLEGLRNRWASGKLHCRALPEAIEQRILEEVARNPGLSSHKLAEKIAGVGNHGVQNILERENLNLYELRLAYSQAQKGTVRLIFAGFLDRARYVLEQFVPSLAPAPPPVFKDLLKPFFLSSFLFFFISLGFLSWIRLISQATSFSSALGLFFATIALLMGSFFFLYSFKYYLTLAVVLSFSQQETGTDGSSASPGSKKKGFLSWILGLNGKGSTSPESAKGKAAGLTPNLEHVSLKRKPYVSIHIPFYNEKNVVERAIAASTNFDYPEYEVILCDDSTDETVDIIRNYQKKHLAKGERLKTVNNKEEGWILTSFEVRPGVTLKHIHRTSRSGFKGGALRQALELTNPKAEFISVFDADFVPYPDTLELFLKYFQVTAGTLDFRNNNDFRNNKHQKQQRSNIAAVQGYQWHVLNKSENWITRGVRSEYAGSYVIERSGREIYGALKQISGAVYMIRRDVLEEVGWETSITEDFQLTLKLYEKGYKVVFTPYIQAPAECVSTLKRLIRQRMRWAEGHSNNIRKMFWRLLLNPKLTSSEKLEFLYLSPYYLQAFFFLVGTISWLISETLFPARLPFWTSLWGWSLVLTNMLSLPLMNAVGLFLEESEEKDYSGLPSFIALSYIVVPFQAYASLKGFLKGEGPWLRTPKTGRITDIVARGRFYRFISGILPGRAPAIAHSLISSNSLNIRNHSRYLSLASANNQFNSFTIRRKKVKWVSKTTLVVFLILAILLNYLSFFTPSVVYAQSDPAIEQQLNIVNEEYVCQVGTGDWPSCDGSGNAWPTDNSLGLVEVNPNEYKCAGSNCGSMYFSTVAKSTSAEGNEFRKSGSLSMPASATEYTVRIYGDSTTDGCTGGEQRTRAAIQLYNKTGNSVVTTLYTTYGGTCYNPVSVGRLIVIRVARISIVQTDATNITDTMTQIEIGAAQDVANQSYAELTAPKYYLLDKNNYSGTKNAYFEATMQGGQGGSSAGRIFMSGFETGDGIEWSSVGGTPTFQGTTKRSGDYAMSTNSSSNYVQYDPTAASLFYVRFGWRLSSISGSPIGLTIYDSGTTRLQLYIDSSNSNKITFSATSNGGGSVVGPVATADTWYLIELKVQVGSGSTIELKVNGVSYGTASGGSTSATVNQFRFAGWVSTQYFDDVVFSSSDFPGDGKIVALQPNALGDYNAWDTYTPNASPNQFNNWNETPTDNDTSVNANTGSTDVKELHNVENASVGGIGASDTINDVWYNIWAKRGNGGTTYYYIWKKWGGSEAGSGNLALNTAYGLFSFQETGSLSIANVDSAQVGARHSGARDYTISTIWMMVDYTPQTTMKAKLQQCNEASCSWSDVTGSEKTTTSTSWTRVKSSNIWDNLTDDYLLRMVVDIDGSYNPQGIANAKFIIDQAESSGITDMELVHSYSTKLLEISNDYYIDLDSSYEYVPGNFAGGNFSYYFEGTILTSAGTGYAKLRNITNNDEIDDDSGCGGDSSPTSEVSTTSTTYVRQRSSELSPACDWPSTTKTMGSVERNSGTGTTSLGGSWLIIQVSNLQIPENLLLMLPLVFFIPKIFGKKDFNIPTLNLVFYNPVKLERRKRRQWLVALRKEMIDRG